MSELPRGAIPALVSKFLDGQLSIVLSLAALFLGGAAILLTPREEDPQIVVPLADIYVRFPGATAEEVEKLVATPLERLLWQIDGVENVYSVSRRDMAIVTVRYFVGEDRERSLVKLHNRISSHIDEAPPGVTGWVIKPVEIDDVPIVTFTLHSSTLDDHALRRIGEEALARLESVENISRTRIVGGRRSTVRVELDRELLQSRGRSPLEVARALSAADASLTAGSFDRGDVRFEVDSGPFLGDVRDVASLVIGVHEDHPVYLDDVARIFEGPEERTSSARIGFGPASGSSDVRAGTTHAAVTLAVAKKKGTNAVAVADAVVEKLEQLRRDVLPTDVSIRVTRNTGETADAKVNELLSSLLFAMLTVVGLLLFTLGGREGLIVALAVPISFALALFVNMLFGYTINRVTLFALILTLGLVVDDPITNVDNIQRHIRRKKHGPREATLHAVKEVLPPVLMSTLTIIVSFLPMFFITGMMGPYMAPMAINVPLTVTFSTLAAICIVPWAAYKLLKYQADRPQDEAPGPSRSLLWKRLYRRLLAPFLDHRAWRYGLLLGVALLFLGSALLPLARLVPMKMLPFDNKNELQLVLDLPEGTTLERTDAVVRDFEAYLFTVPELTDFVSYIGTHSPIDFNGLVRHYYLRSEPQQADIRLNLAPKEKRQQQSHAIALRLRPDLEAIAKKHEVTLSIVETPPGPPVLATIVAEVSGREESSYEALIVSARIVADRLAEEPGVVDVDVFAPEPHTRLRFVLDKEKAGLHGITTDAVVETLRIALEGAAPATVHRPGERRPLEVQLRLSRSQRSGTDQLGRLAVAGVTGTLVPLDELGEFREVPSEAPIYHKNLERVVFVTAESAGRAPAEAILDLGAHFEAHPLPGGTRAEWAGEGEWDITLRVFRDLGLAFGAALIGIYILLVIQTSSFLMPFVIMSAIPLTAVGILPGFWLLNVVFEVPVGSYPDPVFFTATAMIGMIALGGIVVRNSIVLIEFIQGALQEGQPLREAILESGAVRMRPILLTAATTALGAWPITLDPIFSGLAWALIFGLTASTAFTLFVVPVMYGMIYGRES
ncbi:MAG: efflux RND transporter permease subunit [Planctomycetota bacterium]